MTAQPSWSDDDRRFMAEAVRLARRGVGRVEPNPAVGAVLVRNGRIIGRGWHREFGADHAEVAAVADARRRNHRPAGAALYVTLEPCCHWGKTPPCVDTVLRERIARVVVAMIDPSAKVRGRGIRRLRRAGVRVETGLLAREAEDLNPWFAKFHRTGRPWVIGKWAQTLDGKLAAATGRSQWISGPEARRTVHELRRSVQAILTGVGTVLADDPALTVRLVPVGRAGPPLRVVLDPAARTPSSAQIVGTAKDVPTLIFVGGSAPAAKCRRLAETGVDIVRVKGDRAGLDLVAVLAELGRRGIPRVLVESGPKLLTSFLRAGLLDELVVYVSAKIALDAEGRQFSSQPTAGVADFCQLYSFAQVRRIGEDIELVLRKRER